MKTMPFVTVSTTLPAAALGPALPPLLAALAADMGKREATMVWTVNDNLVSSSSWIRVKIEAFDALEDEEERDRVERTVKSHLERLSDEVLVTMLSIEPYRVGALGRSCISLKTA